MEHGSLSRPRWRQTLIGVILSGIAVLAAGCNSDDAPPSQHTCRDLRNCRLKCEDDACISACNAEASPEAKALYDAVFACIDAKGCKKDQAACITQKCGAEQSACLP